MRVFCFSCLNFIVYNYFYHLPTLYGFSKTRTLEASYQILYTRTLDARIIISFSFLTFSWFSCVSFSYVNISETLNVKYCSRHWDSNLFKHIGCIFQI